MSAAARLDELGLTLPAVPAPAGAYVPALRQGELVYTSGQLPFVDGALPVTGKVGGAVDPEQAKAAARTCALNAIAAAAEAAGGLENIVRVVKVTGFVASEPSFTGQPGVINGASELLGEVFGDAGPARPLRRRRHRAADGLPGRGGDRRGRALTGSYRRRRRPRGGAVVVCRTCGSAGATPQPVEVEEQHRAALQTDPAAGDELGQGLVDRLAGGADELGELLLGQVVRDVDALVGGLAEPVGQVQQRLGDAAGDVGEDRGPPATRWSGAGAGPAP